MYEYVTKVLYADGFLNSRELRSHQKLRMNSKSL